MSNSSSSSSSSSRCDNSSRESRCDNSRRYLPDLTCHVVHLAPPCLHSVVPYPSPPHPLLPPPPPHTHKHESPITTRKPPKTCCTHPVVLSRTSASAAARPWLMTASPRSVKLLGRNRPVTLSYKRSLQQQQKRRQQRQQQQQAFVA
jgi:hypothetical protein